MFGIVVASRQVGSGTAAAVDANRRGCYFFAAANPQISP
jgi:hypothetical protein